MCTIIRCCENYYTATGNGFCDFWQEIQQSDKWSVRGKELFFFNEKIMAQGINHHHP